MFILLKHSKNYKGILLITHLETKWINMFKSIGLTKKYFIYGVWCNGEPHNLKSLLATYFTDNIFYKNRISQETNVKINKLLHDININVSVNNDKYFDFIHVGRCCKYKNTLEVFKIMEKVSKIFHKKSLLILIKDKGNDPNLTYMKELMDNYNKLSDVIKENIYIVSNLNVINQDYCISESLNYEQLSLLFNYSKIYIHSRCEFDEARIIGQSLLGGCLLFCNKNLHGHRESRYKCKDSIVEYNINNIEYFIKEAIDKQKLYKFNNKLNYIYNEDITVLTELKRYYKECNYQNKLSLQEFIDKCDKKLWSLKTAGHYNNVPWNIKKEDEFLGGNPTHHLIEKKQVELFLQYINNI